jgi:hypothetical protein
MTLYLSSRRFPTLVIGAALMATASPGGLLVVFPRVIGGGAGTVIPLSSLAPLVLAILVAWSLTSRSTHLAENAARSTGWLDAGMVLALEVSVVAVTLVLPGHDVTVARNALLLVGLSATGTCLVSPGAAAAVAPVFVLLVMTYGTAAPGSRYVRVLQAPPDGRWPLALALGSTVVALTVLTLAPSRTSGGR